MKGLFGRIWKIKGIGKRNSDHIKGIVILDFNRKRDDCHENKDLSELDQVIRILLEDQHVGSSIFLQEFKIISN